MLLGGHLVECALVAARWGRHTPNLPPPHIARSSFKHQTGTILYPLNRNHAPERQVYEDTTILATSHIDIPRLGLKLLRFDGLGP